MSKKVGPTKTKSYLICAKCKYLDFWCGMCQCYARCKHPKYKKRKTGERNIGTYDRGNDRGVPTPKWCPIIKQETSDGR